MHLPRPCTHCTKMPLCCSALYYSNLPSNFSCSNVLQCLLTFKQPSIHSFFPIYVYMHQGGAVCHSIILAAAHPRGPGLCFHIYVRAAGYLNASFSPLNTHSHSKKLHYTINQGWNTPKSYTDKPFSRTHHTCQVLSVFKICVPVHCVQFL